MGARERACLQSPGGVRGYRAAGRRAADKAATSSKRRQRKRMARQPLDPKPVTCRQARSRRRPDDREVVRQLPRTNSGNARSRRISKRNAGGFSHGARRAVSEEGVLTAGARERDVGCRSGFEVTRRCVQGKAARPYEEHIAKRQEGKRPGRGVMSFTSRKVTMARGGRKAETGPRWLRLRIVGGAIEPRLPVPRLSIESVEGAWGLDTGGR
jgi:hypothetical protein